MVFVFLTSFSIRISSSIHVAKMEFFLSYGWVVFHCADVPHLLHSFICPWTFRFFPCLGCCESHCNEYMGACIFLNCSLPGYMPRIGIVGSYDSSIFSFLRFKLQSPQFMNCEELPKVQIQSGFLSVHELWHKWQHDQWQAYHFFQSLSMTGPWVGFSGRT